MAADGQRHVRVPTEPEESDTMSQFSAALLRPMIAKDVRGFVRKYVVSFGDAMRLTTEKHLKAVLNTAADFDNVDMEVAEENDIREKIQDGNAGNAKSRKRLRRTLERLNDAKKAAPMDESDE